MSALEVASGLGLENEDRAIEVASAPTSANGSVKSRPKKVCPASICCLFVYVLTLLSRKIIKSKMEG